MELLFGRNPVLEALRAGRSVNKILVAEGSNVGSIKEIMALAREKKVLLQFVDKKQLDNMSQGENHQGIIAYAAPKDYVDWDEILQEARRKEEIPLLLMLDGIEDPHNFGAILRAADAAGVHGVIIPKHRAVPLTAGVAKASAGAIEYVPVARVTNLAQTMEKLKEEGCWIVGADAGANVLHFDADLSGPLVVVMGSEGKGLGKLVKEKCDFLVSIPMLGRINSLNVSVATSIILYEILRQRRAARGK
ncbi:MAG: methyltransferase, TrmH family, group 3 [Peptococcaceae bacterium]|jgi:23S rRNA (guanosine2251-2'-O)-methyltransferase|nr:methyltransferase, TrmH family, group 3 [Peptococcaceae bacterium]